MQQVEDTLASCMQGQIRQEYVAWMVRGFFDYGVLGDVQTSQVMDHPHGYWHVRRESYEPIPNHCGGQSSIDSQREAAFWPDNFHCRIAVERVDSQ
ncbi:MAG: hypothetical protein K0S45_2969 [Nitrospira sp.]|jgi:hypothetical protein|nr:hypothetical protein [Nitrospira sp.]